MCWASTDSRWAYNVRTKAKKFGRNKIGFVRLTKIHKHKVSGQGMRNDLDKNWGKVYDQNMMYEILKEFI